MDLANIILTTGAKRSAALSDHARNMRGIKASGLARLSEQIAAVPAMVAQKREEDELRDLNDAFVGGYIATGDIDKGLEAAHARGAKTPRGSQALAKMMLEAQRIRLQRQTAEQAKELAAMRHRYDERDMVLKEGEAKIKAEEARAEMAQGAAASNALRTASAPTYEYGGETILPNGSPASAAKLRAPTGGEFSRTALAAGFPVEKLSSLASMASAMDRPVTAEMNEQGRNARAGLTADVRREGYRIGAETADENREARLSMSDAGIKSREKIAGERIALQKSAQEASVEARRVELQMRRDIEEMKAQIAAGRLNADNAQELFRSRNRNLASLRVHVANLAKQGLGEDDEAMIAARADLENAEKSADEADAMLRQYHMEAPKLQQTAPKMQSGGAASSVDLALKARFDALPTADQERFLSAATPEQRAKVGR